MTIKACFVKSAFRAPLIVCIPDGMAPYYLNTFSDMFVMQYIHSVERGESFKPYSKVVEYLNPLQCVIFLVVVNKLSQASSQFL